MTVKFFGMSSDRGGGWTLILTKSLHHHKISSGVHLRSIKFYMYIIQVFFKHSGAALSDLLIFLRKAGPFFTLSGNKKRTYKDNLCVCRNVVCALAMKKISTKF